MGNNPHLPGTRDTFIEQNMGLVYSIAKKYVASLPRMGALMDYDDLISIGSIGIIKAYDYFDPTKFEGNIKFSTYAVPMIEGEINRFFRDTNLGAKISRSWKDIYHKIRKAGLLEEQPEVIMNALGLTMEEVTKGLEVHTSASPMYFDQVIYKSKDGSDITLCDKLGTGEEDPDNRLILQEFLNSITSRERTILSLHAEGKSQNDIGEIVGLGQVQISRILKKIMSKANEYGKEPIEVQEHIEADNSNVVKKKSRWTESTLKARELLSTTDMSIYNISKEVGMTFCAVQNHAKELRPGYTPGKRGPKPKSKDTGNKLMKVVGQKTQNKKERKTSKESPLNSKLTRKVVSQTIGQGVNHPSQGFLTSMPDYTAS